MRWAGWIGAAVLSAAVLLAGCSGTTTGSVTRTGPASASSAVSTPPGTPVAATSSPTPPGPSPRQVASERLVALGRQFADETISAAVRDEDTGATFAYGARHGMWTGSVYKLLVLEALLLERQASGSWFDSGELADITAMIEHSDNAAGYRMYLDAGGSAALAHAAHRLGMRHTRIGVSDPTFTTTSGRDGLAMLRCLVEPGPLDRRSRSFVLSLMRAVESDQRWGVGVVADRGTSFVNKNGWLSVDDTNGPDEDDDGRWVVSSVGIVRVHGHRLLVSIFTEHNPDFESGVRLVERLARIVAPAVLPPS